MREAYVQNLKKLFFLFCWALFLGTPAIESLFLERFSYSWSAAFFAAFLIIVIFLCFDTTAKKHYNGWMKALAAFLAVICFLNFLQGYFFCPNKLSRENYFLWGFIGCFFVELLCYKGVQCSFRRVGFLPRKCNASGLFY
jgi:hypothetical protein